MQALGCCSLDPYSTPRPNTPLHSPGRSPLHRLLEAHAAYSGRKRGLQLLPWMLQITFKDASLIWPTAWMLPRSSGNIQKDCFARLGLQARYNAVYTIPRPRTGPAWARHVIQNISGRELSRTDVRCVSHTFPCITRQPIYRL